MQSALLFSPCDTEGEKRLLENVKMCVRRAAKQSQVKIKQV